MIPEKKSPDKLSQEMGARIAALREANHFTQEKLAEALGISIKHQSAVERGKSRYSYEKLLLFCRLCDCSTDYIFYGRKPDALSELPADILMILSSGDREEVRLLKNYLQLYVKLRGQADGKNKTL